MYESFTMSTEVLNQCAFLIQKRHKADNAVNKKQTQGRKLLKGY